MSFLCILPSFDLSRSRQSLRSIQSSDSLRGEYLNLARLCEKAERYDDLSRIMKEIIKLTANSTTSEGSDLTAEERQMLWVAYKNILYGLRSQWRTISDSIVAVTHQLQRQHSQPHPHSTADDLPDPFLPLLEDYKLHVEKEIHYHCTELLHLIENVLLKNLPNVNNVKTNESRVFYYKLCGDLNKYVAEIVVARPGYNRESMGIFEKKALEFYVVGMKTAQSTLLPIHPLRLNVCLNYSVFLYEIPKEKIAAAEVAKTAFDGAINKLDDLDEPQYKDSTLVMQLLRDNLTLWAQIEQGGGGGAGGHHGASNQQYQRM